MNPIGSTFHSSGRRDCASVDSLLSGPPLLSSGVSQSSFPMPMVFILYLLVVAVVFWLIPAMVLLFGFGFSVAESLIFGFIAGGVLTAGLDVFGWGVAAIWRLARKRKT